MSTADGSTAQRVQRPSGSVPLAWRNFLANKPRLVRSSSGIGFAVLLMLMQLGFEQAFFDSSLEVIRGLDGDIFIQSGHKYQFATRDSFPRSDLDAARNVAGVSSAWPLYARTDLPDDDAYKIVDAIHAREREIVWEEFNAWAPYQGIGALGEETEATPRDVPLHPGAARWFREHGFKV